MSYFAKTRTLSDFPLLIGKMLLRGVGRFELALASAEVFSRYQFTKHGRQSPSHRKEGSTRHNLKKLRRGREQAALGVEIVQRPDAKPLDESWIVLGDP